MTPGEAFCRLPLREQHRRLALLRAALVMLAGGDDRPLRRIMDGDLTDGDGAEVAEAVDVWLRGGTP